MATKKAALGRGLGALLSGNDDLETSTKQVEYAEFKAGSVAMVKIHQIETNPFQPRTEFETDALEELSKSISEMGIIQPVTLRELETGKYQLISGERRYRASQMAGLTEIPAYIRKADDQEMLEMALVENIQREDLNAIEVALSYQRLMEECNLTQEKLSERVSKKRSTITNYLRLLKLPVVIQQAIKEGVVSMGHARAMINVEPSLQHKVYEEIIQRDLSVRQVEDLVRKLASDESETDTNLRKNTTFDENKMAKFKLVGDKLGGMLSHPIQIQQDKSGKGKIIIQFESEEDLDKLIAFFDR